MNTSPYLEQLAELASPVPDFAATLTTQAEQDAEDDNVSFLRTPTSFFNNEPSENQSRRRSPYVHPAEFDFPPARDHAERESQRRMRRAVLQHRRYTPAQLQELDRQNDTSPVLRTALRHPVSYQGWAPGTSDNEADDPQVTLGSLRSLIRDHTDRQHEEAIQRQLVNIRRDELAPEVAARSTAHSAESWGQSHFIEDGFGGEPITTEASLRTAALLQSVRRHARFSARSRNQLENYILERERTGHANEDRERSTLTRQQRPASGMALNAQEATAEIRTRMAVIQRASHGLSTENPPEASRWLEEAIKYLERLRFCDTYSERISSAAEGGFIRGEYFTHDHEDFILDTTTITPPPESSWLKVGGIFSGSQHAAGGAGLPVYSVTSRPTRRTTADRIAAEIIARGGSTGSSRSGHNNVISRAADFGDNWPVKVTITSIDYSNMTLSGTMEAFNVTRKGSVPPQVSSITTFLEGEIIDFNRYTLETKSFSADTSVDSTYWRKLEPFKELTDKEIVSNLVSMKWLSEELGKKWILMRWKG